MVRPARDVMLERWHEVDSLFSQVLERPVDQRRRFLVSTCAGDQELLDTVSTLLESTESGGNRLVGPGEFLLRAAFDGPEDVGSIPPSKPGDTVGPYELVRELGRGGMATVYEAERTDGVFQGRVAIKMLRGVDREDVDRRFSAERQILSSLTHANIARLLDGGTTPEGRPFLVMELVDGEPITSWADGRALSVPERIDLFVQSARAVHYAHTHLVVHRDIKPSNVLVDRSDGSVKLLDFGIAKLLEAHPGAHESGTVTRWMTPEYASPEQVLSRPVTTATDVHSLGVLLFQLLVGNRPFGSSGTSSFELGRAIAEDMPGLMSGAVAGQTDADEGGERPSASPERVAAARGTTPDRLRRALVGDLDAIVAKALRKEPEDRYPSVQAMLDDIERYRTGFPVRAREGMSAYRARKFIRRHRLGAAAAAVVLATLGTSSAVLSVQQAQTERERDRATAAAARAELEAENGQLVIDFLADVFRGRNPNQAPSDTVTARELLAWGTERVDAEFADRPEIQSELYAVMGGAHFNMGLFDEGVVLFERAVEMTRQVHGELSEEVASVLLRLGRLHGSNRDFDRSLPYVERATEIRRELYGREDTLVAAALVTSGRMLRDLGDPDSAEVLLREAVRIANGSGSDGFLAVRAGLGLAYVLRGQGRLEEAEALYERSIPRAAELPDLPDTELASHLNNLAYLRRLKENYAGADSLYRQALEITARAYGRGHPSSLVIAQNLAGTLNLLQRPEEVVDVLRESARAAKAQWPDGHWRVGQAQLSWGRALLRHGEAEASKEPVLNAVRSYTEQLGAEHYWTYYATVTYRVAQIVADDDPEARAALDMFYDNLKGIYDAAGGALQPDAVDQLQGLIAVLDGTGLDADAERFRGFLPKSSG